MVFIIVQPNHRVNTVNKIGVHYRPTQNVCAVVPWKFNLFHCQLLLLAVLYSSALFLLSHTETITVERQRKPIIVRTFNYVKN